MAQLFEFLVYYLQVSVQKMNGSRTCHKCMLFIVACQGAEREVWESEIHLQKIPPSDSPFVTKYHILAAHSAAELSVYEYV